MPKTVIGVFNAYTEAESAVRELIHAGLPRDKVSIIATDRTSDGRSAMAVAEKEAVSTGAGTGAAVGGAAGLMFGIVALALPGIGPIVAAGPIAAALTGAGLGAAAGGLIGSLAKMGVPADHAEQYEAAVRRGGTLVAVHVADADTGRVESILSRQGSMEIEAQPERHDSESTRRTSDPHTQAQSFGDEGRKGGVPATASNLATGRTHVRLYDPEQSSAPDLSNPQIRDAYEAEWRTHCSWEEFSEAWRLGASLAANGRYSSSDWTDVEADARRLWESHPNHWEKAKDIVRRAWDQVRGRR
jgi:hypothetical protein